MPIREQLKGKKTYFVILAYVLLRVCEHNGWISAELARAILQDAILPAIGLTLSAKFNRTTNVTTRLYNLALRGAR